MKRKPSGSAAMARTGKHPLGIWLTPEERETLREAARLDGRKMAGLVKTAALKAAARIIRNGR